MSEQIGCANTYVSRLKDHVCTSAHLPDRVTGKDGKQYPARRGPEKTAAIEEMLHVAAPSRALTKRPDRGIPLRCPGCRSSILGHPRTPDPGTYTVRVPMPSFLYVSGPKPVGYRTKCHCCWR